MSEGRISDACKAFERSYDLDPAVGALLNLAWCHEQEGRGVLALTEYRLAESEAEKAGHDRRARFARQRRMSLQTSIPAVFIDLAEPALSCQVSVDSRRIAAHELTQAILLDPGPHTLIVSASGRLPFVRSLDLKAGSGVIRVLVPRLNDPVVTSSQPRAEAKRPPYQMAGLVVGGAGLAAAGVGAYFGVRTFSLKGDAQEHCQGRYCDDNGRALMADASRSAAVSTTLFVVGAAALATGAGLVLWEARSAKGPATGVRARVVFGHGFVSSRAEF
jgi:hypothetical protein